ncbi:MAG: UDP-N-acetylglucosamine 1-carboxyvinyltransferase [Acidobacteria bacterium]|nr:MAG: UDP-N-acetylglucosamine 1-carboxyvinyltransferase [Acidobacteriota bacterium]
MDKIRIVGGLPLRGEIAVSGAKNAALPEMAACLLAAEAVELENLPYVRDILTTRRLLENMGVKTTVWEDGTATLDASEVRNFEAPYELVKTMRASILVLGPLLGRFGRARVSLPGGCAIGARPVNLHLEGLERMGARCEVVHGYVEATTGGLRGASILLEGVTVTGTENLMMAAALAKGETVLDNAACEPEVEDLARLLSAMGARIEGAGSRTIHIRGVDALHGCRHRVIPDRIEAGTFALAAAVTSGDVAIRACRPDHIGAVLEQLQRVGAEVEVSGPDAVVVRGRRPVESRDVTTHPYPGFPTDMQAQYMALMTQGNGTAVITETIFENRFMHALELIRMGADIAIDGRRAVVRGRQLTGASVQASDLRASASLILAGLVAEGETLVNRVYHLDRGYYRIEEKLGRLGACIERIQ